MTVVGALLKALRPKQWIKNLILFAALVFSRNTFNLEMFLQVTTGFLVFCAVASCGYLYNDLNDIEADRLHPTKRNRPLASGALPKSVAVAFMLIVGPLALVVSYLLRPEFAVVTLAYLMQTLSYTYYFKHVVIVDVIVLASGFVVRAVAGAIAIDVPISPWFLVCTGFGALFGAMSKRKAELLLLEGEAKAHRKILQEYSPELLEQMLSVVTAGTVMSYALYTISSGHGPWLMTTIPFVLYAVFRYQYLTAVKGEGGAPEQTLLKDRPLQITVILYVLTSIAALQLEA